MVQKVVVNKCFGGFSVAPEGVEWIREQGYECGEKFVLPGEYYSDGSGPKPGFMDCQGHKVPRDAEGLVAAVEKYDGVVSGEHASLVVVEVPDGVDWVIDEYGGQETVKEETWVFG